MEPPSNNCFVRSLKPATMAAPSSMASLSPQVVNPWRNDFHFEEEAEEEEEEDAAAMAAAKSPYRQNQI